MSVYTHVMCDMRLGAAGLRDKHADIAADMELVTKLKRTLRVYVVRGM